MQNGNSYSDNKIAPHGVLPRYYDDMDQRREVVDHFFDESAVHYDWITEMMSFGSGRWYRRQALVRAGVEQGMTVLDSGAGTGVVSLLAKELVGDSGSVISLDPSVGMLSEAVRRGVRQPILGLGERLPIADNSVDFVTMGYALRHVEDLTLLFKEYLRVLKPGGKILVLEITAPKNKLGLMLLKLYLKYVVPLLTRIIRRSTIAKELMKYYWDTIENCVPPEVILSAMRGAGAESADRHVVLGCFSEYLGVKKS